MNFKVLPLIKSHFSIGKSIITTEPLTVKDSYPTSVFDLLIQNNIKTLVLVEDSITGLLQSSKVAKENGIKLIFGIRLNFTESIENQDDESLKKRAKYIIFSKNSEGYKNLIKISSLAASSGFYYTSCLDFKHLKELWSENLILAVPFYDSFLFSNTLESHIHIPDFSFTKPIFLLEDNNLPFDYLVRDRVNEYCKVNNYETLEAQSIYYKSKEDFLAYLSFKCITGRSGFGKQRSLDNPGFEHCSSSDFNFEHWLERNK